MTTDEAYKSDSYKLETATNKKQLTDNNLRVNNIFLYHQIWRTLLRGDDDPDHRRRPLPPELVHLISRLANLRVPDSTRTFVQTEGIRVSSGGSFQTKLWFCTSPFHEDALHQIAAIQLLTTSNDQGWAAFPHPEPWTWFEWGLFSSAAEATVRAEVESETAGWKISHRNKIAEAEPQDLTSPLVTMNDAMWRVIAEGSIIAVRVCAAQKFWYNNAYRAEVKFWKWFSPVV